MINTYSINLNYFFSKAGYNFESCSPLIAEYVLGVSKEEIAQMKSIFERSKNAWKQNLATENSDSSLYLEASEIGSPFSLQYFKTGMVLIHTEFPLGSGHTKVARLCIELLKGENFVALSLYYESQPLMVLKKEMVFSRWDQCRGLVPPFAHCYNLHWKREFLFVRHYTMDLASFLKYPQHITEESLKVITLDLLYGLKTMHDAGVAHCDLKEKNILILLNAQGGVQRAGICDFGEWTNQNRLDNPGPGDYWSTKDIKYFFKQNVGTSAGTRYGLRKASAGGHPRDRQRRPCRIGARCERWRPGSGVGGVRGERCGRVD